MNTVSALRVLSIAYRPVILQTQSITAWNYSDNLARSRSPYSSIKASNRRSKLASVRHPSSHDHDLQVHLDTLWITASKCISKLTQLRPPIASPNWLHLGLQVHLQIRSITASKWSPNPHNRGLGSRPRSSSPNSLYQGPSMYPKHHLIVSFRRTLNSSQALSAASSTIPCAVL
jgi:hypothetical protein